MHYIKVSNICIGGVNYNSRCVSDNIGDKTGCIESPTLPWDGTAYRPFDFRYENGEFIPDPIELPEPEPEEPTQLDRIEAQALYTALMTDTLIEEV